MTNSDSGSKSRKTSAGDVRDRRAILKMAVLGGGAAVAGFFRNPHVAQAATGPKEQAAQEAVDRATHGTPSPRIKDVSVIEVGGGGVSNMSVIKVTTDQAGLYGYGCATITMPGSRAKLVKVMAEQYLKPLVMGRTTDRIEQIWQLCYMSSYYKNDNAQNAAIGGLCDALWDIKGRQANMPVYQLVGGKCRDAAETYEHVSLGVGDSTAAGKGLVENAQKLVAAGFRNMIVAFFKRDATVNTLSGAAKFEDGSVAFDRDLMCRKTLVAFEMFRKEMPPEIGLAVDVHAALDAQRGTQYCKDVEQFKLFMCEDALTPENSGHFKVIRSLCSTPLAIGETFDNPHEWQPLVEQRLIDILRIHVSHIGGFTAARKIAAFAENYEVKFAWHAIPGSPVGHMTNLTLDLTSENFGIHEYGGFSPTVQDIFKGGHELKNGWAYVSDKPGWGIEVDEALAAKHPMANEPENEMRTPDGSVIDGTG